MLKTYFAVMFGGAAGVAARLFLATTIALHWGENFPWGTFIINVTGCFIIGVFSGLTGPGGIISASPLTQQVVMIGILGGFTTFSSFSLQTLNLINRGDLPAAFANIFLTVILCLLGTWGGLALAHTFQAR